MQGWTHGPRRLALGILKRVSRDITIRHHHTGDPLRLNLYTHKGYWYHGRRREAASLDLCRQLIRPGDTVYDVGGHIGYLSLYFAKLAGPTGRVHVFEPGENNLPYIERNIGGNSAITLVRKAVGAAEGSATIYLENLAGQNNSLVPEFEGLRRNAAIADPGAVTVVSRAVPVTSLDVHATQSGTRPAFVKIDVEGYELEVLQGMERLLGHRPLILVEVQRNQLAVYELLSAAGYLMFDEQRRRLTLKRATKLGGTNIFALHGEAHADVIARLFTPPPKPPSAP